MVERPAASPPRLVVVEQRDLVLELEPELAVKLRLLGTLPVSVGAVVPVGVVVDLVTGSDRCVWRNTPAPGYAEWYEQQQHSSQAAHVSSPTGLLRSRCHWSTR